MSKMNSKTHILKTIFNTYGTCQKIHTFLFLFRPSESGHDDGLFRTRDKPANYYENCPPQNCTNLFPRETRVTSMLEPNSVTIAMLTKFLKHIIPSLLWVSRCMEWFRIEIAGQEGPKASQIYARCLN